MLYRNRRSFIPVCLLILTALLITGCLPNTPVTYTLTATSGENGLIDPTGTFILTEGENQTFTITPDTGYRIADVLVDGTSVGAVSEYTFEDITADHTISASFEKIPSPPSPPVVPTTYTLTSTSGEHGLIDPSGTITLNEGENQIFTITPDTDYQIADVLVDSTSVGAVSEYTFEDIAADHTISVSFEPIPVSGVEVTPTTLTLEAGGATGSLTATVIPTNAANKNITWSSSDTSVATVSDGVVTPVTAGTATITVTTDDGSFIADCSVTVTTSKSYFTFISATGTIVDYNIAGGLDVVIPSAINGVTVTAIDYPGFYQKGLTSVIIPDSVTSIGGYTFMNNYDLTSLTIGNGVKTIGIAAFANFKLLTSLIIPESVTTIGDFAFQGYPEEESQLTSLTIGNSVTSIGECAFQSHPLLTSVTIPNSVETINKHAFNIDPIAFITIGSGVDIDPNDYTMGMNTGFKAAYDGAGKLAGTYNYTAGAWVKE